MGSGKTSYVIDLLNNNLWENDPKKYLVITPYLEQIERICKEVSEAREPKRTGKSKTQNLIDLLKKEVNIVVCTHELLKGFSEFELLKPYTFLIDESPDVIEVMYDDGQQENSEIIAVEDIEILRKAGYVKEAEDGFLEWIADEYTGVVYTEAYKYLKNKALAIRGNRVFKLLPRQLFLAFQDVYIFTYLFEGQNMYYYCRYFDIPFEYMHVDFKDGRYSLEAGHGDNDNNFPIIIYDGNLNDIGEKGLSKNWYENNATDNEIQRLKNNIYNYLRNDRKAKIKEIIWTTFKKYASKIAYGNDKLKLDRKNKSGRETKGNFVSCSARATNDYKDATVVVYAVNRFPKPEIKQFFEGKNGIYYNEELFALQEMLQFIWRSAVREGHTIHAYIPSKRMRDLFFKWRDKAI